MFGDFSQYLVKRLTSPLAIEAHTIMCPVTRCGDPYPCKEKTVSIMTHPVCFGEISCDD